MGGDKGSEPNVLQTFYRDWIEPPSEQKFQREGREEFKKKYGDTTYENLMMDKFKREGEEAYNQAYPLQPSPWFESSLGGKWRFTAEDMQLHEALNRLMGGQ